MHSQEKDWRQLIWLMVVFPPATYSLLALGFVHFLPTETAKMLAETDWSSPTTYLALFLPWLILTCLLVFALPWRRRERLRARAMAGDTAAMRLALAEPKRQSASVAAREPVALRWKRWGRVSSVTMTRAGVVGHRAPRKDLSLAWDDITLIEFWQGTNHTTGYCLYADSARYIEWPNHARFGVRFIEPSPEQVSQRQDALLGLACARTGLPIRTLESEFAMPDETGRSASPMRSFVMNALNVFSIALLAACAVVLLALTLVAPLTYVPLLNLYTVGVGVILAVSPFVARARRARAPSGQPPPVSLPLPATLVPREAVVVIKIPFTRRDLLRLFLPGVLPVGVAIPAIIAFLEFRTAPMMSEFATMLHWILLSFAGAIALTGIGFIVLAVAPYVSGAHIIAADGTGIRQGRGTWGQRILWQDIADFVISDAFTDAGASFSVTSATQAIGWPVNALWVEAPSGMLPDAEDAGAQFAAIVAQRSGVQPTERWA